MLSGHSSRPLTYPLTSDRHLPTMTRQRFTTSCQLSPDHARTRRVQSCTRSLPWQRSTCHTINSIPYRLYNRTVRSATRIHLWAKECRTNHTTRLALLRNNAQTCQLLRPGRYHISWKRSLRRHATSHFPHSIHAPSGSALPSTPP